MHSVRFEDGGVAKTRDADRLHHGDDWGRPEGGFEAGAPRSGGDDGDDDANSSSAVQPRSANTTSPKRGRRSGRWFAMIALPRFAVVVLLFAINLLNYMDRLTVAGVLTDLQLPKSRGGFALKDSEAGALSSIFVVSYMLLSPVFGFVGDRLPRLMVMLIGVTVWCASTFACSFARSYAEFLVLRSLLGFGEAAYATIAPTLIADLYPIKQRASVLAVYFVATPLGSALGYLVSSKVAYSLGWRWAFRVTPPPTIVLAVLLTLLTEEPSHGALEQQDAADIAAGNGGERARRVGVEERSMLIPQRSARRPRAKEDGGDDHSPPPPPAAASSAAAAHRRVPERRAAFDEGGGVVATSSETAEAGVDGGRAAAPSGAHRHFSVQSFVADTRSVCAVPSFMLSTLGFTCITFISGAFSVWGPAFLQRANCGPLEGGGAAAEDIAARCKLEVTTIFGEISCVAGIAGTLLGAALSHFFARRRRLRADALICGVSTLLASPFVYGCVFLAPIAAVPTYVTVLLAEMAIGIMWAPVTAMLLYVMLPRHRALAAGVQTLLSHLLGDAFSPTFVGWFADTLHVQARVSQTTSLQDALYPAALLCILGALFFFLAALYVADDRRRVTDSTQRRNETAQSLR